MGLGNWLWRKAIKPAEKAIPDPVEQILAAGAGAVVGGIVGSTAGPGGTVMGALSGAGLGSSLYSGIKNNEIAQSELAIAQDNQQINQQELSLQYAGTFNDAKNDLINYQEQYDLIKDVTIPTLVSDIDALNRSLDMWDEEYSYQTGQIEAQQQEVNTALGNWQGQYDVQMGNLQEQGRGQLGELLSNWTSTNVVAGERGATGSMGLVAGQQKSNVVRFAGSDMRLAGGDGLYGQTWSAQDAALQANKQSLLTQQNLLSQNLALTQNNLNAEKTNWEDQLGVLQGNLVSNIDSLGDMSEQIGAQYGVVDDARKAAGYGTDMMAGLSRTTDNYSRTELEDLYTAAGLDPATMPEDETSVLDRLKGTDWWKSLKNMFKNFGTESA
jgi:hypothetical protein